MVLYAVGLSQIGGAEGRWDCYRCWCCLGALVLFVEIDGAICSGTVTNWWC